ncbi:MAG: glycoside hydrolase [Spirochaetes bacterium]|nr:glycoside hydrolase [Spirochaetota bacterium]
MNRERPQGAGCRHFGGISWSAFSLFSVIFYSGFLHFTLLIRPLWYEINGFIVDITGIHADYVIILFAVTCLLAALHAIDVVIHCGRRSEREPVRISPVLRAISVVASLVWGVLLYVLISEGATSIPSIISCTGICVHFSLFFLIVSILLLAFHRVSRRHESVTVQSDAIFYPNRILAAVLCIAFVAAGLWSRSSDLNRWPPRRSAGDEGWRAGWITVPDRTPLDTLCPRLFKYRENMWVCFRKRVVLEEVPRRLIAKIGADSRYWLWINGVPVVREGGLKRGPNPHDTYYDEVDLSGRLRKGENVIAVLLWFFGKEGFSHNDSGTAALIFECGHNGGGVISDGSWKVRVHPAFYTTGAPIPNYRLPEANIAFDARRDMPQWTGLDFDDSGWGDAQVLGRPPVPPFHRLVKRPIPLWKAGRLRRYEYQTVSRDTGGNRVIQCGLPYNAQVSPYLAVDSPEGLTIGIQTDNYEGGGAYSVRMEYRTSEGAQSFEFPSWMNGHRVRYTLPPGVRVIDLRYRESGYDTSFAGSFHCNDDFLNALWKKSARTLYLCMRDSFMDCPDRERAQWWGGDIVLDIPQAFYALDVRSHALMKKAIDELVDWRKSDGTLYAPIPSGNWFNELPIQMLAAIGHYGFWTYYLYSGDRETVRRAYPHARRYLSLWKTRESGLVIPRPGDWNWADWGSNIDVEAFTDEWYYLALMGMNEMAAALGREKDAGSYEKRMASFRNAFQRRYWTDSGYRSPGYTGVTDDRVNALAVTSGLASPEKYPRLKKILVSSRFASPYMEKYVIEALVAMGYADEGLARLKERYHKMVASSYSTLWEGWDIGSSVYGGGTNNHSWAGGGLIVLSGYIAGIMPVRPGFREFRVLPREGGLTSVDASMRTVRGDIRLSVRDDTSVYRLSIVVPGGTRAGVYLHRFNGERRPAKTITVNRRVVLRGSRFVAGPGVDSVVQDRVGYYRIGLHPGSYRITVRY